MSGVDFILTMISGIAEGERPIFRYRLGKTVEKDTFSIGTTTHIVQFEIFLELFYFLFLSCTLELKLELITLHLFIQKFLVNKVAFEFCNTVDELGILLLSQLLFPISLIALRDYFELLFLQLSNL